MQDMFLVIQSIEQTPHHTMLCYAALIIKVYTITQVEAVKQELRRVTTELEAGRLTLTEAAEAIRACEAEAPDTAGATALLMGLAAGGDGTPGEPGGGDPNWLPQMGERVAVLTMGGAPGVVILPPSKIGGKVGPCMNYD